MTKSSTTIHGLLVFLVFLTLNNTGRSQELAARMNGAFFARGLEFQNNVDYYFNDNWGISMGINFGDYSDPLTTDYDNINYRQFEIGFMRRYKLGKSILEPFYSVSAKSKPSSFLKDGYEVNNERGYWINRGLELETGFELNITKRLATRYAMGVYATNGLVNAGFYYTSGFRYSFFYKEK